MSNEIRYSEDQQLFLDRLDEGKNIFLTGKAGTGKTFVVKQAMKLLQKQNKRYIALAPTGISAHNIGGQTLHSMFALSVHGLLDYEKCSFLRANKRKIFKKVDVIFIDEVSMLRPDILDALNWTLLKNGLNGLSSKQIVFIGDLKQLPAPIDDNMMTMLLKKYQNYTFENAKIFNKLDVETIDLEKIHRQQDPEFIHNLNIVRDGGKSEYFKKFVKESQEGIVLAPHNATVANYNQKGLNAIEGKKHTFKAVISGKVKAYDFNLEETLVLKDGCKIMYLINSKGNPLYNGSIGIYRRHENKDFIEIKGEKWLLEPVELHKKEYVFNESTDEMELKSIGSIAQLPVKLAYALTIHKSQGLTFEKVTVDLTKRCFAKGQLYTALSRVTSPEGLTIKI